MLNVPNDNHSKASVWGCLILSVLICVPALLIKAGDTEPDRIMENHTMVSSQETWLRQCGGETEAWRMPSWNGRPRIEKPPMSVWLNMLAWTGLDPASSTTDQLVLRARWLAAGFAILALLSTFWAGMSLTGNPRTAALAVLAVGTCGAFVKQARFATYDTHMLGFVTLAIAAGLWAIRPGGRSGMGWVLSGLALGAAVLVKGPLAFALAAGPLALAAAMGRTSRVRAFAGLALSTLLAALCALPWTLYMVRHVAEASTRLAVEYLEPADVNKPPWYYLALIGNAFPWSLWLAFAIAQPIVRWRRERTAPGFSWWWFLLIFVMFSIPGAKSQRYIVPILPAAGLLIAGLCDGDGLHGGGPAWFRRAHWSLLIAASAAIPLLLAAQALLTLMGRLASPEWPGLDAATGLGWGMALLGLALLGLAQHRQGRIAGAALATALWGATLLTPGYWSAAQSPRSKYAQRTDAERVAVESSGRELVYLAVDPNVDVQPTKIFLFYVRRIIPCVTRDELSALAGRGENVDVIVRAGRGRGAMLEPLGFRKVLDFSDDDDKPRELYRLDAGVR